MRRTNLLSLTLIAAVLIPSLAASPAAAQDPIGGERVAPDNVAPLMRRKLDRAKNILEGLTLEQFDKIASNARSLRLLSMEAGWNVVQTEEYRKQSDEFRRACNSVEKAADGKDVHRAALAYVSLTVRCVECHSYMRENKIKLAGLEIQDRRTDASKLQSAEPFSSAALPSARPPFPLSSLSKRCPQRLPPGRVADTRTTRSAETLIGD